jgi:hypothetical protein
MALFNVKVSVLSVVEIPVHAESEDEALAYMRSTDEWKDDYAFSMFDTDSAPLEIVSAEEVTDPKSAPRECEGDCFCWGEDEVTIAHAFYGSPPRPDTDYEEGTECEESKSAWDAYFDAELDLIKKFNKARSIAEQSKYQETEHTNEFGAA